jgi:hypothetical protein
MPQWVEKDSSKFKSVPATSANSKITISFTFSHVTGNIAKLKRQTYWPMDREEKKKVTRHGPTTDMKPSHYFAKENEI